MTIDLKGPYDMVEASRKAYEQKASEIATLLNEGTDEQVTQALALQESLDTLQADLKNKEALYAKLVAANTPSDVTSMFVPVSKTEPEGEDEKPNGKVTLAEYHEMSPTERLEFAKAGGRIEEGELA